MEITYSASDGYVSENRPLRFKIDDSEILDQGSVKEAMDYIEDAIQEDFLQKVSAAYDTEKLKKKVAELFASQPKGEDTTSSG